MQATWYERQGPAHDVLVVGTMADPQPGPGEVRIRVHASGINPGDVKKRQDLRRWPPRGYSTSRSPSTTTSAST